jgi:hypothetical protein
MVILSTLELGFMVDNDCVLMEGGCSRARRREVPWQPGMAARWYTTC